MSGGSGLVKAGRRRLSDRLWSRPLPYFSNRATRLEVSQRAPPMAWISP
jgi:hypothetical protein